MSWMQQYMTKTVWRALGVPRFRAWMEERKVLRDTSKAIGDR